MSELNLIWAEDLNGWIGKDNTIPWHVSADMKHFKTKTTGHPIIMGRRTFASLGNKPLPKRENIVLTSRNIDAEGVEVVHSLAALKEYLKANPNEYFVIGGATIYQQQPQFQHQLAVESRDTLQSYTLPQEGEREIQEIIITLKGQGGEYSSKG